MSEIDLFGLYGHRDSSISLFRCLQTLFFVILSIGIHESNISRCFKTFISIHGEQSDKSRFTIIAIQMHKMANIGIMLFLFLRDSPLSGDRIVSVLQLYSLRFLLMVTCLFIICQRRISASQSSILYVPDDYYCLLTAYKSVFLALLIRT